MISLFLECSSAVTWTYPIKFLLKFYSTILYEGFSLHLRCVYCVPQIFQGGGGKLKGESWREEGTNGRMKTKEVTNSKRVGLLKRKGPAILEYYQTTYTACFTQSTNLVDPPPMRTIYMKRPLLLPLLPLLNHSKESLIAISALRSISIFCKLCSKLYE